MKLRNVVKITGKVLFNELRVDKNFKNENIVWGYLIVEVSDYSLVRVNVQVGEFTNAGERDKRYDAMLKALTLKSKASYGVGADTVHITSGFLLIKTVEDMNGLKGNTIEVRTNFISVAKEPRANQITFELEGFMDRIENDLIVIKQINYNMIVEEFSFTTSKDIINQLEGKVGNIVMVKGKVERTVEVIQLGDYMVATTPAIDRFYIEEWHESINNSNDNIVCLTQI